MLLCLWGVCLHGTEGAPGERLSSCYSYVDRMLRIMAKAICRYET